MTGNEIDADFARAVARLLQGVVYNDDSYWKYIQQNQVHIMLYLERIGLELIVDQPDGYAYLRQVSLDEEDATSGLVRRTPMTYEAGLICIFLRERLDDFDIGDHLNTRCLVPHKQIKEDIELFFKEKANFKKFLKEMDKHIRKVVEYGFLKLQQKKDNEDENVYEIKRIIKAKISSDQIHEFKEKMEAYA